MTGEPQIKRAIAFFDGQNLFYAAREAFGYRYPNYDPIALAQVACQQGGWQLAQVRFYTGVPDQRDDQFWNHFWVAKLGQMGREGVHTFSRALRYRHQTVRLPDGSEQVALIGQEKGIDIRIALDVVRLAHRREYDVGVIFSQDQDLSEVAEEIRVIAREQNRYIKLCSAFPSSPTSRNTRGINKTDWLRIDRTTYTTCVDKRDYRPKQDQKPDRP
ncbi:MAG: NYN domain-containing protein [Deltaproteobacteria bacterium]|nr:NYN domain-containing protein [Deltaproteobacteria bacterium]